MTVIAGGGEVGTALAQTLAQYDPIVEDPKHKTTEAFKKACNIDYLHICFPYSESFISDVKEYQSRLNPKYTIIHSTVPVGVSRGCDAIHSPIVGIHPHLEQGIRTFTRFLGGEKAGGVADYFRRAGLKVYLFDKQETTELLKLLDTQYYALCIEYTKEIKRLCDKHEIPFDAWRVYNEDYNRGYAQQGYGEYVRPTLVPIMMPQGGHCTIPNLSFLETRFAELIRKTNTS